MDKNVKAFVVYIAYLILEITIYLAQKAEIALLLIKKVLLPKKYPDFAHLFLKKSAKVSSKHMKINKHTIKLQKHKLLYYGPIYSLGLVELEILKTYIKTNLANSLIWLPKTPAGATIFFVQKPNNSLHLYINYWGLNNFTIKNWYLLPLIGKIPDKLDCTKDFIQLDLTSPYYQMRIKEKDEWKTAFQTKYGHFESQLMLFGLSNVAASFQGYINMILAKKTWYF